MIVKGKNLLCTKKSEKTIVDKKNSWDFISRIRNPIEIVIRNFLSLNER